MLVRYQFVNGEISEVEVNQEVGEVILALEYEQGLRERTETRRHVLLQNRYDGEWCAVDDGIDDLLTRIDAVPLARAAFDELTPKQRELLYVLYMSEMPLSQTEYAIRRGASVKHVKQAAWRARESFKAALKKLTLRDVDL